MFHVVPVFMCAVCGDGGAVCGDGGTLSDILSSVPYPPYFACTSLEFSGGLHSIPLFVSFRLEIACVSGKDDNIV